MKDYRYLAYGPAYADKMGTPVHPGDTVKSDKGEAVIASWQRPQDLNSAGRVYVRAVDDKSPQPHLSGWHPVVYGLEWAGSISLDGEPGLTEGTYKIVRNYFAEDKPSEVVARGLTLQEAQGHCKNPETNSRTCTQPLNKQITAEHGHWFDGYEKE